MSDFYEDVTVASIKLPTNLSGMSMNLRRNIQVNSRFKKNKLSHPRLQLKSGPDAKWEILQTDDRFLRTEWQDWNMRLISSALRPFNICNLSSTALKLPVFLPPKILTTTAGDITKPTPFSN